MINSSLQRFDVEVYNGKSLIEVISVKAKDNQDASKIALNEFFEDINVKTKRAYN